MGSLSDDVAVLHDNPPLPGKKFFLASKISPESRQKNQIYGFKIHDMCETEDDATRLCGYYHRLDPDFDVYVGTVGKWVPWLFSDDIPSEITPVYANNALNDLIHNYRKEQEKQQTTWEDKEDTNIEPIRRRKEERQLRRKAANTEVDVPTPTESPENFEDNAVPTLFKIAQLERVIAKRHEELEALQTQFDGYSESDKAGALKLKDSFPLSIPAKFCFQTSARF